MGSGFRTFTAGEVLTASNVQNYLQDQVVMTFAGSAARSSAIGTANFEEGMVSYLTDTDKVEAYNGTNWVQVGSSNQGLTLINTTSFSGVSSQSINDVFSATYDNYRILITGTTSANSGLQFRLRVSGTDATGANYHRQFLTATGTTVAGGRSTAQTSTTFAAMSSTNCGVSFDVYRPFDATPTVFNSQSASTDTNAYIYYGVGYHDLSTSYTGLTFFPDPTLTVTGIVRIYGYND